jgi:hypothetical protein
VSPKRSDFDDGEDDRKTPPEGTRATTYRVRDVRAEKAPVKPGRVRTITGSEFGRVSSAPMSHHDLTRPPPETSSQSQRIELQRLQAEEIVRLRSELERRDSDASVGETMRHTKRVGAMIGAAVSLCATLFAGLAWYTTSAVNSALLAERLETRTTIDRVIADRLSSAHYATADSVMLATQKLSELDAHLARVEQKLEGHTAAQGGRR